jgi:hypothetical protein
VPDKGKPFKTTLPGVLQVALIIGPTEGAVAGGGAVLIDTPLDDPEKQDPAETIHEYVTPPANPETV